MQTLKEMLQLNEAANGVLLEDLILENLGNLTKIDKDLMKVMFNNSWMQKGAKLKNKLGQNSPIDVVAIKSARDAFTKLTEDPNVMGLVLTIDGVQVGAISAAKTGYRNSEDSMVVIKGAYFYEKLGAADGKEFDAEINKRARGAAVASGAENWELRVHPNKLYGILTALTKTAKTINSMVQWLAIGVDSERVVKQSERNKAKADVVPLPRDNNYKKFVDNARYAIKARLDKFKSSKAKEFKDAAELVEYLIEEGYLDKFKFDGYTYDLYDERITLRALRGKDTWNSTAYVEYRVNTGDDAYKKYERDRFDLYGKKYASDDLRNAAHEKFMKTAPAKSLKVVLKLDGGKIIPTDIELEKSNW